MAQFFLNHSVVGNSTVKLQLQYAHRCVTDILLPIKGRIYVEVYNYSQVLPTADDVNTEMPF